MNPLGALAAVIVSGIGSVISSLIAFFGRKALVTASTIALFVGLTLSLYVCLQQLYNNLMQLSVVPSFISEGLGWVMPGDFWQVMGAILSARACRAAYDLAIAKTKIIASAN